MWTLLLLFALAGAWDNKAKPDQLQVGAGTRPFDVTKRSIDLGEIAQGAPRDGILPLVDPKFVSAAEARRFLSDNDEVLGVVEKGKAKAYPIKILTQHEVVNDRVGGRPVAVTY